MFATVLAISCAAPVPTHLMKEQVPVGTYIEHNNRHFDVTAIKVYKDEKYYRIVEKTSDGDKIQGWAISYSVIGVIKRPDQFFFIYVDLEENK